MDQREHRAAAAHRPGDRDAAAPSAMVRHRDGSDRHHHPSGTASAHVRAENLDFVRDAIRLTYR